MKRPLREVMLKGGFRCIPAVHRTRLLSLLRMTATR